MNGRSWSELHAELVAGFGSHPWERDSDTVRRAFELHPVATRRSAALVLERFRAGKVRDPWRILALRVDGPAPSSSADEGPELATIERRLSSWIVAEGVHYERDDFRDELEQRLAGVVDEGIRARLEARWSELRQA